MTEQCVRNRTMKDAGARCKRKVIGMERIDAILSNDNYRKYIKKNLAAEENRIFCRHNIEHFLDVARIGTIINLEEQIGLKKEFIYAAALLHDIGRHIQYENKTPHEIASAQLASDILRECGFDSSEEEMILVAIRNHRNLAVAGNRDLAGVLYRADKASRACFACRACGLCDWDESKKNLTVKY